jgi:hypothetical protein
MVITFYFFSIYCLPGKPLVNKKMLLTHSPGLISFLHTVIPAYGDGKKARARILDLIFENLVPIFWVKNT